MKKIICLLACVFAGTASAAPINVDFSFDTIATGSFSYDDSLDGTVLGYSNLDSFQLDFQGLTTSSYDLAFVLSGNSAYQYFQFDTSVDSFLSGNAGGFNATLTEIKNGGAEGFFILDSMNLIADYAGGGSQHYQTLSISVDRQTTVAEPTTLTLLGLGLAGIGFSRKKKRA